MPRQQPATAFDANYAVFPLSSAWPPPKHYPTDDAVEALAEDDVVGVDDELTVMGIL